MSITPVQESVIKSLKCDRLSSIEEHTKLVQTFSNRNDSLRDTLTKQECAWNSDAANAVAYYIVKSPDETLLFYFSLQCGSLYEELDVKTMKEYFDLAEVYVGMNTHPTDAQLEKIREVQIKNGFSNKQVDTMWNIIYDNWISFQEDKKNEKNKKVKRVHQTYPGVELVQFCGNESDEARSYWKSLNMPENVKLGEVIFWYHILPKIQNIRNHVGCKYLFLFAADESEDGKLMLYYQNRLHFERGLNIGVIKPLYDFNCFPMMQELSLYPSKFEEFKKNFNTVESNVY